MKYLITAIIITASAYAVTTHAQAFCYPQLVATPQGIVTVIVCQ